MRILSATDLGLIGESLVIPFGEKYILLPLIRLYYYLHNTYHYPLPKDSRDPLSLPERSKGRRHSLCSRPDDRVSA